VNATDAFDVKKSSSRRCGSRCQCRQFWYSLESSRNISQPYTTTGINICCKEQAGDLGPVMRQKNPAVVTEYKEMSIADCDAKKE
jgi:hypothetical protein